MKDRTVAWMESKITQILGQKSMVTTYLALSSLVLRDVRSVTEQTNLDVAIEYLISKKLITRSKDNAGYTTFSLAA